MWSAVTDRGDTTSGTLLGVTLVVLFLPASASCRKEECFRRQPFLHMLSLRHILAECFGNRQFKHNPCCLTQATLLSGLILINCLYVCKRCWPRHITHDRGFLGGVLEELGMEGVVD